MGYNSESEERVLIFHLLGKNDFLLCFFSPKRESILILKKGPLDLFHLGHPQNSCCDVVSISSPLLGCVVGCAMLPFVRRVMTLQH